MTIVADAPRADEAPYVGTNSVFTGNSPMNASRDAENDVSRIVLQPAVDRLNMLRAFKANWDGRNSPPASRHLISRATDLLGNFYVIAASTNFGWSNPVLNLSDDGNVVMEWWRGLKKLTLYIAPAERPVFIRVWGDDIDAEMDDGVLAKVEEFATLWVFLNS